MFKSLKKAEEALDSLGFHRYSGRLWCKQTRTMLKYCVPYRYGVNCWYIRIFVPINENPTTDDEVIKTALNRGNYD